LRGAAATRPSSFLPPRSTPPTNSFRSPGAPPTTIINVATRGTVVPTDPVIGGFVIQGAAQRNVLIRAVGPTLASFGVPTALADPVLTIYDSSRRVVATNSAWGNNANLTSLVAVTIKGAFPLLPNSKDAALYLRLDPRLLHRASDLGLGHHGHSPLRGLRVLITDDPFLRVTKRSAGNRGPFFSPRPGALGLPAV
jgi:hypothetical protein